ncbi:hypothetical protein Q4566_10170 [Tamlana sp. 2_MG-2023]|uniref:hypothetical protein n=1 Tax=unclassified Tamlana TaxID=2614803 RepID=UPI0026E3C472|nr:MULTISPECIES: hypothetical protein [unclassified Tamlana]MDO6760564.1 hypothetical protein [Tamlana sp. 2_MG-2023]MDO6790820.1 hypothetical protein [Tamlana sp. 1_MG-2023]
MKNLLRTISLIAIVTLVFTSCSSDDNPADNDLFAGTYEGQIGYNDDNTTIASEDGSVFVTKVGDTYNFDFSNSDIPSINGIEFEEDEETNINIGGSETSYIRIDESSLNIFYNEDGKTWTADCTR